MFIIRDPNAPQRIYSDFNDPRRPKDEPFFHFQARSGCLNTALLSCGFHTNYEYSDTPQAVFDYEPGPSDLDYDVQYDADRVLLDYIVLSGESYKFGIVYYTVEAPGFSPRHKSTITKHWEIIRSYLHVNCRTNVNMPVSTRKNYCLCTFLIQ